MALCLRLLVFASLLATPAAACWRCQQSAPLAAPPVMLVVVPVAPGELPVYVPPYVPPPAPPAPAPAPLPPAPAPAPAPGERQSWVYYVVDADRATPGQLELARSPAVRKAVQRAGMGWRLLRSDQAQLGELGLTPIVEREGLPVLVLVDERGIVLQVMRSPMESDVVGAIGHATTRALH